MNDSISNQVAPTQLLGIQEDLPEELKRTASVPETVTEEASQAEASE